MPNDKSLVTPETEFKKLLRQKKLTNVETAKLCQLMAGQLLVVNESQVNLQGQNTELSKRMARMETLVLDQPKPDGGIVHGLAHSLQVTQKTLAEMEEQLSSVTLSNQVLRRLIPWMITEQKGRDHALTEEEVMAAHQAIQDELIAEGDAAVEQHNKLKEIASAQYRCAGCVHWKEAPTVVIPGEEQTAGCTIEFVQVKCPGCFRVHGLPLDPNNIKGTCVKCQTKLTREVELPEGTRTMCGTYKPNIPLLREVLLEAGIQERIIDAVVPKPAEVDG